MKYIKQYENTEDKYKKGEYIVFKNNRYKLTEQTITAGKPYEIIGITKNNFEMSIIILNDKGDKTTVSFFDNKIKKIPTETAKTILGIRKFNI